jgi:hypothetical protein
MNQPFVPNAAEDLFLRAFYQTRGCNHPLTEAGFAFFSNLIGIRYPNIKTSTIRFDCVNAFISATATRKPRKVKVCSEATETTETIKTTSKNVEMEKAIAFLKAMKI